MFKQLCMSAACFAASPLLALTVRNVEVPLPPSNYEWRQLTDNTTLSNAFLPLPDDLPDEENGYQVFTHREGDALELFTVAYYTDTDENDLDTMQEVQGLLKLCFPNHRLIVTAVSEEGKTAEWEYNDGHLDLMHGFTGIITGEKGRNIILSYSTTAQKGECNRFTWQQVLTQARLID